MPPATFPLTENENFLLSGVQNDSFFYSAYPYLFFLPTAESCTSGAAPCPQVFTNKHGRYSPSKLGNQFQRTLGAS